MKDKDTVAVGDAIEVRLIHRDQGEVWRPATVAYVADDQIVFVFSDGERRVLPARSPQWRLAAEIE